MSRSTFGVLALFFLCACTTLPHERATRALYVDARKALVAESRLGWTVDRVEIEEAAAQVEPSACRVPPELRAKLRAWVERQIAAEGGPAKAQYEAGRDVDDLDEVIALERVQLLLEKVEARLPEDCPFWVKPSEDFEGEHSVEGRFILIGESMGGASVLIARGQARVGGGGGARLFVGYGFAPNFEWALGFEAGGDAILENEKEEKGLSPRGAFRFAVPTFFRFIDIDRIYDIELAITSRLENRELTPFGGRVAFAGGVTGLRRLGFMPALQIWVGYELFPEQNGFPTQHSIRLGTRVGFDWDP